MGVEGGGVALGGSGSTLVLSFLLRKHRTNQMWFKFDPDTARDHL